MRLRHQLTTLGTVTVVVIGLGACGNVKEQFGLTKQSPDEFRVVTRAPLTLPPDASLRPPRPGEARPQEGTTMKQARASVFGIDAQPQQATGSGQSVGEMALLKRAGADEAKPEIRSMVNEETRSLVKADEGLIDQVMFWKEPRLPRASVVDPEGEARRLREAAATGAPPNKGVTPSVDSRGSRGGLLDGLF